MRLIPIGLALVAVGSVAAAKPTPPPVINVSPPPVAPQPRMPVPPPPLPPPPMTGIARPASPKGNPAEWVTNNDYPTRAMREERQGTTGFRLTIGPDGRPVGCDITSSSGSPDLDSTACSLLIRRARFYPALGDDGAPVVGTWHSRFRWVIPEDTEMTAHPMPGQSVITFTISEFGYPTNCQLVSGPDPAAFVPFTMPCDTDARYPIYKDGKGNPVARQVRMVIGVTLPGAQPAARRKKRKP